MKTTTTKNFLDLTKRNAWDEPLRKTKDPKANLKKRNRYNVLCLKCYKEGYEKCLC